MIKMNQDKALRIAQSDISNRGPYFRTEMCQYAVQLGFEKGVEYGKQDTIEKVIAYLENITNDFSFNEELREIVPDFIESLKQVMMTKEN